MPVALSHQRLTMRRHNRLNHPGLYARLPCASVFRWAVDVKLSALQVGQQARRSVNQGSTQALWNTWPHVKPRTSSSLSNVSMQIAQASLGSFRHCRGKQASISSPSKSLPLGCAGEFRLLLRANQTPDRRIDGVQSVSRFRNPYCVPFLSFGGGGTLWQMRQ